MTRDQLEHLIRAAAAISNDEAIVIVGSQSILGRFPDAPVELLRSIEADVFPLHHPERADLIDGSIGEGSPFHLTFGYYAQGVGPSTAVLPAGWRDRLVPVRSDATRGATGWALEPHDLLVAKYVAGRPKDLSFTATAVAAGLVDEDTLRERIAETALDDAVRALVLARLAADVARRGGG